MKTVKFEAKRLQQLADLLRTVPRKRFNIGSWVRGEFCNVTKPAEVHHNECGSSACAFGWACTIPAFQRAGLRMTKRSGEYSFVPRYKRKSEFQAAMAFFGINVYEADYMFGGDNKNGSKRAARRIELTIKQHVTGKIRNNWPN